MGTKKQLKAKTLLHSTNFHLLGKIAVKPNELKKQGGGDSLTYILRTKVKGSPNAPNSFRKSKASMPQDIVSFDQRVFEQFRRAMLQIFSTIV
jgi:hypothetical protein